MKNGTGMKNVIVALRKQLGITQHEFGELLNTKAKRVSAWENGVMPHPAVAEKINAMVLGLAVKLEKPTKPKAKPKAKKGAVKKQASGVLDGKPASTKDLEKLQYFIKTGPVKIPVPAPRTVKKIPPPDKLVVSCARIIPELVLGLAHRFDAEPSRVQKTIHEALDASAGAEAPIAIRLVF